MPPEVSHILPSKIIIAKIPQSFGFTKEIWFFQIRAVNIGFFRLHGLDITEHSYTIRRDIFWSFFLYLRLKSL